MQLSTPFEEKHMQALKSPFLPLMEGELQLSFAQEMRFGAYFAQQADFYRAITCYQRALAALPEAHARRTEIEYEIVLCYYLGKKYGEVVRLFEKSQLPDVGPSFPAFFDLLTLLHDSYRKIGLFEKADKALAVLLHFDPQFGNQVRLSELLAEGEIEEAAKMNPDPELNAVCQAYQRHQKSVQKAKTLNALLPGAGYWYLGQKKTAVTAFLLNSLFIAGSYQFFDRGYTSAGIFTASVEMGWYFGGIQGAGLAAEDHNRFLYQDVVGNFMREKKLFPQLMLQYSF
jgi:tetratricopeptide (TPR) repeat protein